MKTFLYKTFVQPFVLLKNSKKKTRFLEIGPSMEGGRIQDFETINICKTKNTDYVGDITSGFPFSDNTFDRVYASHIFEHIVWYKLDKVFSNLFKVVKNGGYADIWVPDGLKIAKAFVDAELSGSDDFKNDGWYRFNEEKDPAIWFNGRTFSYGDGKGTKGHFNFHLTSYSSRLLKEKLLKAGFSKVEILDRSEVLGHDHGWINLGVRAYK